MTDKDFILNNLHGLIKDVEHELVKAILKDDSQSTERHRHLTIPVLERGEITHVTLRVTLEYEI